MSIRSIKALLSLRLFYVVLSAVVDGLLQIRILKASVIRWIMHVFLFAGFVILVVFHVFDNTFTVPLVRNYAPTLDPFMLLRNVFGLLVLVGLLIAAIRRYALRKQKIFTNASDLFLLFITFTIIVSGFFLEASKIVSEAVYDDMVYEYADMDDDQAEALKAFWAREFHVTFESLPKISDDDMFDLGEEMHEEFCAGCHTRPQSAFVSFSLVTAFQALAAFSNTHRLDTVFFYVHVLSTLIALALLPFTKAFHLLATPLSMALNRAFKGGLNHPDTRSVKRMIELDACVHCGACSNVCSVGPIHTLLENETILPSEKLRGIAEMIHGKSNAYACEHLLDGCIVCTDCYRCNEACPAGIDLRDLWLTAEKALEAQGHAHPRVLVTRKSMQDWTQALAPDHEPPTAPENTQGVTQIIDNPEFFSGCVQCTTCANVCPVVEYTDGLSHDAGMSPQQVMNFLRLEMKENAYVAGLTWNCTTCYLCQEHCPQNIPVTEIINELRCRGFRGLRNHQRHADSQDNS